MIFYECFSDERLVKALTGLGKDVLRHSFGKPRVCSELSKRKDSKGLIDEDKGAAKPPYLAKIAKNSPLIDSAKHNKLRVHKDPKRNNCLIIICPRLEEWILEIARKEKVSPNDFDLPETPGELHKISSKEQRDNFEKFIRKLQAQGSEDLKALQSLLLA
jgi:hypothetical protein